jgi:hypothetical protein
MFTRPRSSIQRSDNIKSIAREGKHRVIESISTFGQNVGV